MSQIQTHAAPESRTQPTQQIDADDPLPSTSDVLVVDMLSEIEESSSSSSSSYDLTTSASVGGSSDSSTFICPSDLVNSESEGVIYIQNYTQVPPTAFHDDAATSTSSVSSNAHFYDHLSSAVPCFPTQASLPISACQDLHFLPQNFSTNKPVLADVKGNGKMKGSNASESEQAGRRAKPYDVSKRGGPGLKESKTYKRYPKPPYSYLGMIATAIENSHQKRLTLSEIHEVLRELFAFFRGDYLGWKDSVRHTLSLHDCFYKHATIKGKRKVFYWQVDRTKIPAEAFRRQDNKLGRSGLYKTYIHEQLGLPPVSVPSFIKRSNLTVTDEMVQKQQPAFCATSSGEILSDSQVVVKMEPFTPTRNHSTAFIVPELAALKHDGKETLTRKLPPCEKVFTDSPEHLRRDDVIEKTSSLSSDQYAEMSPLKLAAEASDTTRPETFTSQKLIDFLSAHRLNITSSQAAQNLSTLCKAPGKPLVHRPTPVRLVANSSVFQPLTIDTSVGGKDLVSLCRNHVNSDVSLLPVNQFNPAPAFYPSYPLQTGLEEIIANNGYYTVNGPHTSAKTHSASSGSATPTNPSNCQPDTEQER